VGYVRCKMAFPIRGYQLLAHPHAPTLRVLAIETDDGPVALALNKEIAETIGQALLRVLHHQGAIDMAKVELIYGRDPVLRRLAQGIMSNNSRRSR
jgi:hypothetical protein